MVIAIDVVVSDADCNPEMAQQQTVQVLADILPYVLRKYRIVNDPETPPSLPQDPLAEGKIPSRFSALRDFRNAG